MLDLKSILIYLFLILALIEIRANENLLAAFTTIYFVVFIYYRYHYRKEIEK